MSSYKESPEFRERMKDGRYQFSEEEKRALRECRFESFWYRSVPLAAFGGITTHTLVQRGYLNASKRFGTIPKVMFASVCGYIIGKLLYVKQCRDKFLKLENSPFAEMMRRGRGGMPGMGGAGFGGMQMPGYGGEEGTSVPSELGDQLQYGSSSFWRGSDDHHANMDIDTSNVRGIENLPDIDDFHASEEKGAEKPEMTMTYDELRKRNREKHAQQYTQVLPGHYQPKQPAASDPSTPQRSEQPQRRSQPQDEFTLGARNRNKMKNQYGDVWDKE